MDTSAFGTYRGHHRINLAAGEAVMHRPLATVALGQAAGLPAPAEDAPAPLVFTHVTVIDAAGAAPMLPLFVAMGDTLGTVQKRKVADLVLLDADPLDDIRNTQKIHAVVLRGKWLPRPALDKMLADVAAANEPRGTQR
jgi:hypothetical protein